MQKTYYAVTNQMPDAEGEIIIVTTPASIFDTKGCLSDKHDSELEQELMSIDIYGGELMDSHFEVGSPSDIESVKAKLESHPCFISSTAFDNFALNFGE